MLQGLAVFRWAAWVWMAIVLVVSRHQLRRPGLAAALVGLALVATMALTVLWRNRHEDLLRPGPLAAELAVGASLLLFDGIVRHRGLAFGPGQSLGSVWPLVGVLSAGVALGPLFGAGAGAGLGLARVGSTFLNHANGYSSERVLSLLNTGVFYALAGAVAGYVYLLMNRAERRVAEARAREEVARTLHDGVLQTLAIVERRATDPALARLAREQERDLREFLFGNRPATSDLGAALRAAGARFEDAFHGRAQVLVPDDVRALSDDVVAALAGAVGEALTNAGKHGAAGRVVVFVDDDGDELFCSVKDDGAGFDGDAVAEGVGLTRSVRGRIEEVGGRVEVVSAIGRGTEVRVWLP